MRVAPYHKFVSSCRFDTETGPVEQWFDFRSPASIEFWSISDKFGRIVVRFPNVEKAKEMVVEAYHEAVDEAAKTWLTEVLRTIASIQSAEN